MGCEAQLACLFTPSFFRRPIFTGKVGHTDVALVCDEGSLVRLRQQDYKSLCAMVTISAVYQNL